MLLVRWIVVLVFMASVVTASASNGYAQRNNWQQQQQQQFQLQQQRQQQLFQQQRQQQLQLQQQQRMQEQQAMRQRLEQQRIQIQQQQQRMQQLQQQRLQQLQTQRQQLQLRQAEQQRLQQQRQAQQRNQQQQIDQKRALQTKDDQRKRDEQALAGIKASHSPSAVVPAALQARLGAVAQRMTTDLQQRRALQQAGRLGSSNIDVSPGGPKILPRSLGAAATGRSGPPLTPQFNEKAISRIKAFAAKNPGINDSVAHSVDPYIVGGKKLTPIFNAASKPSAQNTGNGDPPPQLRPLPRNTPEPE